MPPEADRAPFAVSILDLAPVRPGETVAASLAASVELAQHAEQLGYRRVWYAEHHNMATIASSATSVLIAHVAASTSRIRLGAGGVMLPNHSPLVVAEQFGTLASLHPGRIDLGVGRAPGSDRPTMRALRRDGSSADRFPEEIRELQGYLGDASIVPGVEAMPGKGTNVPIYVLGSSMFGATLAAAFGLPYAFASHFVPDALEAAVTTYRRDFRASAQCERPYVLAGLNVVAADTTEDARRQLLGVLRLRVASMLAGGRALTDEEADALLASPAGAHVAGMLRYAAVGTASEVAAYARSFAELADADELIAVLHSTSAGARLRAAELLAGGLGLA